MSERILIIPPSGLSSVQRSKLIDHIAAGEEVNKDYVEIGLPRSQLVGLMLSGDEIISSAVFKNPLASYTDKVFRKAKVDGALNYRYELGYIATNRKFERKGFCQGLFKAFFPHINHLNFFATSRKPSMIHILQKFGMESTGEIYDDDLCLLIHSPRKK
ncbi:hypothetical protein [Ferruginibacter sp.]